MYKCQLKELEKLGPRKGVYKYQLIKELEKLGLRKGVIIQSVKYVVQSLMDNDLLVSKDKDRNLGKKCHWTWYTFGVFLVGLEIRYIKLHFNQRNVTKKLESDLQSSKKRHIALLEQCESLKKGREDSSKKRGLSLEEKREKMLEIFYDSQDFYLLKELEKLGPRKGVISQSVKDVVQSLVDDDLVSKDKIGTSVYFWSLPSCAGNQLRNVTKKLESELQSSKKRHVELVEQCESLKKGREDSDAREEALIELKAIEQKYHSLKAELGQFADNDPATFEAMKEATKVAHDAANRWTDNIFTMRQWCSKNFPQAKEQLEHLYNEVGITEDLDYLE
ncbi:Meiotic nuclear division protein 1 [Artemisia annua]|uniref:Meiotic nuclear division protein 1 n=1 Tax=Artemisia annua TaxID=35608 RepID=A0A2U1KV11_ARTAN|nr:Meiotic nuclear division protein 1 [Artemisia annua]